MKPRVEFIEIVADATLRQKEIEATEAVRRLCPECGPVKLYRTSDGRVGIQLQVSLAPGNRKLLDDIYRAVMKAIGQRRGRPVGLKTVQTKLRLPEPVYDLLKKAAEKSHSTMSNVVADSLRDRLDSRRSPERRRSHS
jgi:predicted RNA-binding Zn-ribbon protein involved in translation (DUF1610 family)